MQKPISICCLLLLLLAATSLHAQESKPASRKESTPIQVNATDLPHLKKWKTVAQVDSLTLFKKGKQDIAQPASASTPAIRKMKFARKDSLQKASPHATPILIVKP